MRKLPTRVTRLRLLIQIISSIGLERGLHQVDLDVLIGDFCRA